TRSAYAHSLRPTLLLCRLFFFSSRRRHTRSKRDWSSDVCSSDLSGSEIVQQHSESFFMKRPDHLSQLFPVSFGKGFRHLKLYIFRAQLMFLQICSPLLGKIFRI